MQKGKERLAKHDLEKQETSHKSSQFEKETPCTSHTNKHASSHKHTNSSHKSKSKIPPAVMYTWQYKYKVKKALPKKEEDSCAVLGSLVRYIEGSTVQKTFGIRGSRTNTSRRMWYWKRNSHCFKVWGKR